MPDEDPGRKPHEHTGTPPLPYRNPQDDQAEPGVRESHIALGAVLSGLIWFPAVPTLLYFAFTMDYRGAKAASGILGISIALTMLGTLFGLMVLLTVLWRRSPVRRHVVMGMWIGFGISFLIQGLCFMGMASA